jgi:acetylornithine/N-succinyldiaminopimelate aminotransferase
MIGIETVKDPMLVVEQCREQGVLVLTAKNKVRLLPALNIPQEELSEAINIIKSVCAEG